MKYKLHRAQQLYCDSETAWRFFSSPHNLSRITPNNMGFAVLSDLKDEAIYEGMEIIYKMTPLLAIPIKWKTRITQVEPLRSFTDFQVKEPYKLWNHHHEFIENKKGILMKDNLTYEMPFGFLGKVVHSLIVKEKLKKIFDYRYRVLEEEFNSKRQKV